MSTFEINGGYGGSKAEVTDLEKAADILDKESLALYDAAQQPYHGFVADTLLREHSLLKVIAKALRGEE